MNLKREFKKLIWPIVKGLPITGGLIVLASSLALRTVVYQVPEYETNGAIRIDNQDFGLYGQTVLDDPTKPTIVSNYMTEVELLRSKSLHKKAFERIRDTVLYYRVGNVKTVELGTKTPFEIEFKALTSKYLNRKYYIHYLDSDYFSLYEDEKMEGEAQAFKEGEWLEVPGKFKLRLKRRVDDEGEQLGGELHPDDKFSFKPVDAIGMAKTINGSNLFVKPLDKEIYIVKVYFRHELPEKAKQFVDTLLQTYIDEDIRRKKRKTDETLDFVNQQINKIEDDLALAERNLASFREKNKLVNVLQETDGLLKKMNKLSAEKFNFDIQELELQNVYEFLLSDQQVASFSPDFQAINDGVFKSTYLKLKDLELERADKLSRFTEQSIQITTLDKKIIQLRQFSIQSLEKKLLNIADKRDEVQKSIDQISLQLKEFPNKERSLKSRQRSFSLKEATYNMLMKKRTELEIAISSSITSHDILDHPTVPKKPISPNKSLIFGMFIFLAIIVGMLISYQVHYFFGTVHDVEDLQLTLPFPLFAHIKRRRGKDKIAPFINLFTNFKRYQAQHPVQIISLSSGLRREGRTFSAQALAEHLAINQGAVLFIDMDFNRPELHHLYQVKNNKGVYEILKEQGHLAEYIQPSPIPGLHVMSSGIANGQTTHFLLSPAWPALLKVLRSKYRYIIIDTSPALEREDVAAIISNSDLALWMARKSKTRARLLHKMAALMENHQLKIHLIWNKS